MSSVSPESTPGYRPEASVGGDPLAGFSASALFARYDELRRYVGWTSADEDRMAACRQILAPFFFELIDDFYDEILCHDETKAVLGGDEQRIQRLKRSLAAWLEELFRGPYDVDYVVRRWRVGMRHVEIGLPHVFAVAALSRLRKAPSIDSAASGAATARH